MADSQVKLYYKSITAEVISAEHGITAAQLDSLAGQTSPVIQEVNRQREAGETPYRDLPHNKE
ncbi:MAG: hypothetical protein ACYSTZ_09980, partial [Planctomycetota bacterium]